MKNEIIPREHYNIYKTKAPYYYLIANRHAKNSFKIKPRILAIKISLKNKKNSLLEKRSPFHLI